MFSAARAHGRPMIVIAMMTAATSQPAAIQMPPSKRQSRLRINDIEGWLSMAKKKETLRWDMGSGIGPAHPTRPRNRTPRQDDLAPPFRRRERRPHGIVGTVIDVRRSFLRGGT